jgi:penicillin-binding protein 1C
MMKVNFKLSLSRSCEDKVQRTSLRAEQSNSPKFNNRKRGYVLKTLVITSLTLLLLFVISDVVFPFKIPQNYSLLITDCHGNPVYAFLNGKDKWRMECRYEELPSDVVKAIVHKEDKYFFWHFGVNPAALARAIVQNVVSGKIKSGASTITMQLARMVEPRPRTFKSKMIEALRALQLEVHYSKKEILTMYLNHVPYGGNIEGVKAASLLYFGQMPVSLSLAQVSVLASIPNDPNGLRPGVNDDALLKKRDELLLLFKKDKTFSEKTIADALNEPLQAQRRAAPMNANHYSWFLKRTHPQASLLSASIDLNKQEWLEKKVAQYAPLIRRKGAENIAVLVIRNHDRSVLAWQGSVDFYEEKYNGQVNGVRAVRSPGSTLKPLIYALSYDKGLITPKKKLLDLPVSYQGYAPQNYDGKFKGSISAEEALSLSLNIPAVSLLNEMGINTMTEALTICNFRSIEKKRNTLGLSLALGGCGCSLYELTGLYAAFADGGVYKPITLLLQQNTVVGDSIISPAAAYVVTENLTKLRRPDLPNGWELSSDIPRIAWKTGTSYGRRDAWAIGYNPDYTIGVWIGNFSGKTVSALNGAEFAVPLLFDLFSSVDTKTTGKWFVPPADMDYRLVCTENGLPPANFCSSIVVDCFKPGVSLSTTCQHLINVFVNKDSTISYCRDCHPETG